MSTIQRMTLVGMFNYDSELFAQLTLPEGYDKETYINSLLLEHGEKCVMYTDPEFFKMAVGMWSRKWELELTRIFEALTAEYNPIYNYDRFEEITDSEGKTLTSATTSGHTAKDNPDYTTTQSTTDNATHTESNDTSNSNTTTSTTTRDKTVEHKISADNSSSYSPEWHETTNDGDNRVSGSGSEHGSGSASDNRTGSATNRLNGKTQDLTESSNSTTNDVEDRSYNHTAHIYGNIGVTTSATMVGETVRQRFAMNLYDITTRLFANELLIGMY